jgi:hypothetical protein
MSRRNTDGMINDELRIKKDNNDSGMGLPSLASPQENLDWHPG